MKRLTKGEAHLKTSLLAFFQDQAKTIAGEARRHDRVTSTVEIFRPADWLEKLKDAARSAIEMLAVQGAAGEANRKDSVVWVKDGLDDARLKLQPRVRDSIDEYLKDVMSRDWWDGINDGVKQQIEDILRQGIADGLSGDEVADKINEALGGDADARAERITRSESTGALNAGADAVRQELALAGVVSGKMWLAIEDKDTRETHAEANEQEVAVDEEFDIGGEAARYPGDPNLSAEERVNCRCTVISLTVGDEADS